MIFLEFLLKKQKVYLRIGIITISISLLLSFLYRPYIYKHEINDFGFADIIGSLFSVIAFCCIVWSLKNYTNKEKNQHIIIATIIYALLWELFGVFKVYGVFDWKDIVAGLISGSITLLIKNIIERKYSS